MTFTAVSKVKCSVIKYLLHFYEIPFFFIQLEFHTLLGQLSEIDYLSTLSAALGFHTRASLFLAENFGFGAARVLLPGAESALPAIGQVGTT